MMMKMVKLKMVMTTMIFLQENHCFDFFRTGIGNTDVWKYFINVFSSSIKLVALLKLPLRQYTCVKVAQNIAKSTFRFVLTEFFMNGKLNCELRRGLWTGTIMKDTEVEPQLKVCKNLLLSKSETLFLGKGGKVIQENGVWIISRELANWIIGRQSRKILARQHRQPPPVALMSSRPPTSTPTPSLSSSSSPS